MLAKLKFLNNLTNFIENLRIYNLQFGKSVKDAKTKKELSISQKQVLINLFEIMDRNERYI